MNQMNQYGIPIANNNDMIGQTYTNAGLLESDAKARDEIFHSRLKHLYPCVEDVTKLPRQWSDEARAQPLCLIGETNNKLGCYFRSSTVRREEDDKIAAAVVTDNHITRSCLIYYYEITLVSKGREGSIGLGLAWTKNTSEPVGLSKLPGWARQTYGYHADDGHIFNGDGRGHAYGETFTTGDVVGCGFNLVEGNCFFTKNGVNLGIAFKDMPTHFYFYPTVGLRTHGEEILANFGQEEFKYDIEQDLRFLRKNMTNAISNHPISNFTDWQSTLHKLVQSWLIQNSYSNTAESFSKSTKLEFKENRNRLKQRQRIQQLILDGQISEAINLIPRISPNLLHDNPNLLFALRCRQFIELVGGSEKNYHSLESISDLTDRLTRDTTNGSDSKTILQQNINMDSVISMDASTLNGGDVSNANGSLTNNCTGDGLDIQIESNSEPSDENQKLEVLLEFGLDLTNHLNMLEKLYGKNETNEKMLHEARSLIAHGDPKQQAHYSKLLDPKQREPLSQLVNNSIVEAESGESHRLPMDEVMNHLRKVIKLNDSYGRWLLEKLH